MSACFAEFQSTAIFDHKHFTTDSVATRLRCGGQVGWDVYSYLSLYYRFTGKSVGEIILKISEH